MLIEKKYKKTEGLKRKLIPIKKLKKVSHYTRKIYKTKAEKAFEEAFKKWPAL